MSHWIAIDWGTTNFRALLVANGEIVDKKERAQGILTIEKEAFETTLYSIIGEWIEKFPMIDIYSSGMVGSQQGWHEVDYLTLPVNALKVAKNLFSFKASWGSLIHIVPGITGSSRYGQPDIMRGEETQLIGLSEISQSENNYVILPGTHSKHCEMKSGELVAFSSYMTGEFFSLLMDHSMIGKGLDHQINCEETFIEGLKTASKGIPFSHLVFSARTKRVNHLIASEYVGSYLSGILIGYELQPLLELKDEQVWVVAGEGLGKNYLLAGKHFGLALKYASGSDCFFEGMKALVNKQR
nr:2-dehydro-3-deoxygalactonokinase [Providencia huaxiensis]